MVGIAAAISARFPNAKNLVDWGVMSDGVTEAIYLWNVDLLGPIPSESDLSAWSLLVPPPTDWPRFKRIALGSDSLNSILVAAYQSVPVAAGALAPALMRAESGDHADFAAAWAAINRAVAVPPEVVAGFVAVAQACNLPPEFVAALQPSAN